ncbi:protein kintoun [Panulirus ornatus]|uniref:protein kintoun n=1 Tax=Panulirus ornatus TaxID=150431 RepID=UPI003A83E987
MASIGTNSCDDVLSKDDLFLLAKSLKDDKFRALFSEYAREICDPENQKQFEREVKELEKERGVEAVFVHPSPGFALAVGAPSDGPVFVNICSSDVVQKPSFVRVDDGKKKGQRWSLPHALPKPRRELIGKEVSVVKGGNQPVDVDAVQSVVHDVVFHPDALHLASCNHLMRNTLIQTAMDSLQKNFQLMKGEPVEAASVDYVGKPVQSVIKRVMDRKLFEAFEQENFVQNERTSNHSMNSNCDSKKTANAKSTNIVCKEDVGGPVKPEYKIKHVSKMDLQDFSVQLIPQCGPAWRPQTLEVEVQLPGVTRASQVDASVWKQSVLLSTESTPQYKLELPLPYPVDENLSAAKFDVSTQKLILSLSVTPTNKKDPVTLHDHSPSSDSGIECESDYRTSSDGDNSSEMSLSSQEDALREVDAVEEEEDSVFEPSPSTRKAALIPSYSVIQDRENLYLVLSCGNVLSSSVDAKQVDNHTVTVDLSSIGGGQTLLEYGLKVVCSPHHIANTGVTYKIRNDNVEVTIKKALLGEWETCQIGDDSRLTRVVLSPVFARGTDEEANQKPKNKNAKKKEAEEKRKDGESCIGISRVPRMSRTVSMCETGMGQTFKLRGPTCSWPRGILKRRTRSLSESQVGSLSSIAPLGSVCSSLGLEVPEDKQKEQVEEEGEESVEESISSSLGEKKSVRFNEVVSRQLFRSNSSILGQRAKNQKKAMKKRKCQQRRTSESDPESNLGEHSSDDLISSAVTPTDEDTATATDTTEGEETDYVSHAAFNLDFENNNINNNNMKIISSAKNQDTTSQSNKKNDSHKGKTNNMNKNISSNHMNNNKSDNIRSNDNDNSCDSSSSTNNSCNDNEEVNANDGFIVKTSKKKKKSKKNKNITFEPANNFIFQLDIDD